MNESTRTTTTPPPSPPLVLLGGLSGLHLIMSSRREWLSVAARHEHISVVSGFGDDGLAPDEAHKLVAYEIVAHEGDRCATYHQTASVAVLAAFERLVFGVSLYDRVHVVREGAITPVRQAHGFDRLAHGTLHDMWLRGVL